MTAKPSAASAGQLGLLIAGIPMLKSIRRFINRKLGVDIVRTTTFHRDMDEHLARLIAAKGIDAVIDVGANIGQYARVLRKIGFKGTIYSFEPVSHVFETLKASAAGDARWHCFPFALGDKDETKTINVYSSDVFSSFLTANDYSKGIWKSLNTVREEEVQVKRLDAVFPGLPRREGLTNFMLKLDTQGFDVQVFRGARETLPHVAVLQSELGLVPIYDDATDPYAILKEYHAQGFFISGMYPINRDPSLAIIEFDVTLVRRDPPSA